MNSNNLSPLEVLQKRKNVLQEQYDSLADKLEEDVEYLRRNMVFLLGESALSVVASKMPPFAQGLFSGGSVKEISGESEKFKMKGLLKLLAEGAINITPFFLRGKKGFIASLLLRQLKKVFF